MVTDRGTVLFHYTRLATAIEHILPTGRIKLSPLSEMRDPRESEQWFIGVSEDADQEGGTERLMSLFHSLQVAKARYKVFSLTDDSEAPPGDPLDQWTRGYAHPRLWEHYAENHCGVCLCFHKEMLLDALRQQFDRGDGSFRHRAVAYQNRRLVAHFSMQRVLKHGGDEEAVIDLFDSNADEFLFNKLRDWETEVEYRVVVSADHDEPVYGEDLLPAISYVLVGARVDPSNVQALRELCEPNGIGLRTIRWINGQPMAAPVPKPGDPPTILMAGTIPTGR